MSIKTNLLKLKSALPSQVTLVAVSKTKPESQSLTLGYNQLEIKMANIP